MFKFKHKQFLINIAGIALILARNKVDEESVVNTTF